MVVWFTGLSGAGKSTLAQAWWRHRLEKGIRGVILDGDRIREAVRDEQAGHDREGRVRNAYRICRLARLFESQGHEVVVATMSLFHEIHQWNREHFEGYLECFVTVDESVLRRRHPERLYDGNQPHVVGKDLVAEFPLAPHLTLQNNEERRDFADMLASIENALGTLR